MEVKSVKLFLFNILVAVNIHSTCPGEVEDQKAAYKSGENLGMQAPMTLDTIKSQLKEHGVFNCDDETLTAREKKEMNKLFEAVEIMITSRARQPSNVQSMFSSLRIVERAVKKQLKERQISESLSAKFNWANLTAGIRNKRMPLRQYKIDSD